MKERIFVFRLAKGNDSGSPVGNCPLDYSEIKKEISKLTRKDIQKIDYDPSVYLPFLYKELWSNDILRQGWSIKDLDLRYDTKKWIENYMYYGKIYWDVDIECRTAKGRWNIVSRMLRMRKNDYILIPKTSNDESNTNDYNHFVICQVDREYYFDYPTSIQDFGHCIKIKNIKIEKYGSHSLNRNDFSAPYIWAITEVKSHHSRYSKFKDYIENLTNQSRTIKNRQVAF